MKFVTTKENNRNFAGATPFSFHMLIAVLALVGFTSSAQETIKNQSRTKAERTLFKRSMAALRSPAKYEMRENRKGKYDPKPRVVPVDENAGRYELRWIGYDGKLKVVAYQRMDALDALVEGEVHRDSSKFVYRYNIKNLPTSPSFVGAFIVQTFSKDVKKERIAAGDDLHIGHMSSFIPQFSDGIWRGFTPLTEGSRIKPGTEREFRIVSGAQPGIVSCYARAGDDTLKGVGEHMPYELEKAMPGYEELASCITIGPDERLGGLSIVERANYLLDNLPRFVEAGWMAGDTPKIYRAILEKKDLARALEQARKDLENEFITSEVFHIIDGLNQ